MNVINIDSRSSGRIKIHLPEGGYARCGKLTDAEVSFLWFIQSYPQGCTQPYNEIAHMLNWSRSKLYRVVRSLVGYGLLKKTYGEGKSVTLKLAPGVR